MLHKEALKLLTPFALGESQAKDLAVEGDHLDQAGGRCRILQGEVFGNSAYELLDAWERTYATAPFHDDSLQIRQNRVVQKMSELGRLDRAYFVQLGAALGYTIAVEELCQFMAGWGCAGDELGDEGSDWCWRVYYSESSAYVFRAGEALAGELLSYSLSDLMKQIFEQLKPADTFVEFTEV